MAKKSYFLDKDIQFHFKNTLKWEDLVPLYEEKGTIVEGAVDMYAAILKELGTIAVELGETARESDEVGAKLQNREITIWDKINSLYNEEGKGLVKDETEKDAAMLMERLYSIATERLAKINKEAAGKPNDVIYTEGFKQCLKAFKESDALALNVKREYTGPGMPGLINMINVEMACKADASFMTVYAFYSGVAKTLEAFASEEMKKKYIPMLVSGECGGSMSLTEPNAGSDLSQIKTVAKENGKYWEITGNKIFISNGNGELSLVLARSGKEEDGTKGLSMYLVPRFIEKDGKKVENFKLERLEHKLGIRASPTLELSFENSVGYLVGKENEGLKEMLYLMNEARLGVSVQALGIAQKAFEEATEYAEQRVQFGKPIGEHELTADKLLKMEVDLKAMRSMIYKACFYADMQEGLEHKLRDFKGDEKEKANLEKRFKKYKFLAREMVPLVKYFAAETCVPIALDNIQVHGGNGFTTEYDAERHLRDSVITKVYEGTSQIQALMAVKDTLDKSKVLPYIETLNRAGRKLKNIHKFGLDAKLLEAQNSFNHVVDYLRRPFVIVKVKKDKKLIKKAESYAQLSAERLTRIKAYKTIMEILVGEAKQFPERKWLAEQFVWEYLPKIKEDEGKICSGNKTTLERIRAKQKVRDK